MRSTYRDLLSARPADRRQLYQTALQEWSTSPDLIEKDLMVCAVLDVLFGDVADAAERLVFKGGTSLSKAHRVIRRFSEDVDLVVVRGSLGFSGDRDPMHPPEGLSRKKREALIEDLKRDCAGYISSKLVPPLVDAFGQFGITVELDPKDQQTILVHYDSVVEAKNAYNPPTVKIEGGARSATLPAHPHDVRPYVDSVVPHDVVTPGVNTIDADRTFLDKLLLVHGRHCHFRDRGTVYKNANRESRHYYDLAMMASSIGPIALAQPDLLGDVIHHSRLAFNSGWAKFDEAERGELLIELPEPMIPLIAGDYAAMEGMILGDAPSFAEVMDAVCDIGRQYDGMRRTRA